MYEHRKRAKHFLKMANKEQFNEAIDKAHLTPMQEQALRLCVEKDMSLCRAGLEMNCSDSLVKKLVAQAYDKAALILAFFVSFKTFSV